MRVALFYKPTKFVDVRTFFNTSIIRICFEAEFGSEIRSHPLYLASCKGNILIFSGNGNIWIVIVTNCINYIFYLDCTIRTRCQHYYARIPQPLMIFIG